MYQFALIGYPIKHSLSPWIHRQFLHKGHLKGEYHLMELAEDQSLHKHLERLQEQSIHGFNVTVPYKQKIIPYIDMLDEEAKVIGAVNTVLRENNKWKGFNTDGIGYVRSLEQAFPQLEAEREKVNVLILGAGGAARGIYYALMNAGYLYIDIANRTPSHAKAIASLQKTGVKTRIKTLSEVEASLSKYKVIIQTTSVGMKPVTDQTIISLCNLTQESIVSDIVYQPIETKFLAEAKAKGAYVHYGHTMLLYQAQYAFEIWTNKRVPLDGMADELKQILEGESHVNW